MRISFSDEKWLFWSAWILLCCTLGAILFFVQTMVQFYRPTAGAIEAEAPPSPETVLWQAPDTTEIPRNEEGDLIRYGRELISHTAEYLGPVGKFKAISNGMNCQNCHLGAGTVPYGNNYAAVASKYPVKRHRSGKVETVEMRINDCIERSLNGEHLDEDSREMKAMVAYLKWVGKDVTAEEPIPGIGLLTLQPLDRPADPIKGRNSFIQYCSTCHGDQGEGLMAEDGSEWFYPPLFGPSSYNTGAGLYRLSMFAAYIKSNMPFGVTFEEPVLTDEEAWDIAAYVNSMHRPQKEFPQDWPDISKKPFDHPFGPFADTFSETQHKYGPFKPILEANQRN
jgi:thiosulfate dehydrogenase